MSEPSHRGSIKTIHAARACNDGPSAGDGGAAPDACGDALADRERPAHRRLRQVGRQTGRVRDPAAVVEEEEEDLSRARGRSVRVNPLCRPVPRRAVPSVKACVLVPMLWMMKRAYVPRGASCLLRTIRVSVSVTLMFTKTLGAVVAGRAYAAGANTVPAANAAAARHQGARRLRRASARSRRSLCHLTMNTFERTRILPDGVAQRDPVANGAGSVARDRVAQGSSEGGLLRAREHPPAGAVGAPERARDRALLQAQAGARRKPRPAAAELQSKLRGGRLVPDGAEGELDQSSS